MRNSRATKKLKYEKAILEALKTTLDAGKPAHLHVISQSMFPFLKTGDITIVEMIVTDNYDSGDMIVFENNHSLITHRLVIKGEKHWVTKGDNTLNPDPPLEINRILGIVSAIQRGSLTRQMHSFPWKGANRIIARINLWQIRLLRIIDTIASRLFGNRQISGISLLRRLFVAPFKFIYKLLIISLSFFEQITGR